MRKNAAPRANNPTAPTPTPTPIPIFAPLDSPPLLGSAVGDEDPVAFVWPGCADVGGWLDVVVEVVVEDVELVVEEVDTSSTVVGTDAVT